MRTPQEIEQMFYTLIPITQAMGVRVLQYDEDKLVLTAPLALNHNHLHTAFGGSLNALAILCGYGVLWLELDDPSAHIVIRRSSMEFHKPVASDLTAVCRRPSPAAVETFRSHFTRRKKARIDLSAFMESNGQLAAEFTGTFVAVGETA